MKQSERHNQALTRDPTAGLDLHAYLKRIGYDGEPTPTIETLRDVQLRHAESIAFENLNPLMGWPVHLDIESLQQKLVRSGRGGYCFEQNLLLKHTLEVMGFHVTGQFDDPMVEPCFLEVTCCCWSISTAFATSWTLGSVE